MRMALALALVVAVVALPACASEETQNPPSSHGADDAAAGEVSISGFAFKPQEITIKVGETVTWTNEDSVLHTVSGEGWDSGDMGRGDTYSWTFTAKGTYSYDCRYHPYMTGKVIVE